MTILTRKPKKPYRLGLALSGGGARGFAHVGAIRALEEHGLRPDVIAGVSAGSVVAVLYAGGCGYDRMLSLFRDAKFRDFAELSVPRDGFFRLDRFKRFIVKSAGVSRIEQLAIPTMVCATDFDHGNSVAFTEGPLGECVVASCSIPIVFKPVRINGVSYVDGGVLHNLPAWAVREKCDRLIGINCSPLAVGKYKHTLIDIAHRSYSLLAKSNARQDMKLCDLAVEINEIADYQVFNLKDTERVYRSGYKATVEALKANGWID